jgi:hypothetical protein
MLLLPPIFAEVLVMDRSLRTKYPETGAVGLYRFDECCRLCIQNFSFIDEKNQFAAGASYGGYMINWLAGHTDRFNALVSHAGVFNLESMYGTTEELWFTEGKIREPPGKPRSI